MWVARGKRLLLIGCGVGAGYAIYQHYGPVGGLYEAERALKRMEIDTRRTAERWKRKIRENWPWR